MDGTEYALRSLPGATSACHSRVKNAVSQETGLELLITVTSVADCIRRWRISCSILIVHALIVAVYILRRFRGCWRRVRTFGWFYLAGCGGLLRSALRRTRLRCGRKVGQLRAGSDAATFQVGF